MPDRRDRERDERVQDILEGLSTRAGLTTLLVAGIALVGAFVFVAVGSMR